MHEAGEIECLLRRHHIAMHDMKRIAGLPHMQPRERAPSAADGIEGPTFAIFERAGILQRPPDDLLGLLDRLRRDVLQREPAQRKRQAGLHPMPLDLGQLERAAAEVADDPVGLVKARHDTERGKFGLALAGEDVDLGATNALGFCDEGLAVLGITAGGSCDRPELGHLHAIAQRAKAP